MSLLTHLSLVGYPVFRQRDELLGGGAAAVTQNVTFQLEVGTRSQELHGDGVTRGVDLDFHIVATDCNDKCEDVILAFGRPIRVRMK